MGYPSSRAPAVFRAHLLPSPVDGRAGLKEDEVADSCVEGVRYAAEIVEAHAHAACFDAPDMGLAAAHHEGELLLRQALGLPSLAYRASQERSFLVGVHLLRLFGIIIQSASYMKPLEECGEKFAGTKRTMSSAQPGKRR